MTGVTSLRLVPIIVVVALVSIHARASGTSCHFPAIFNFGDSNSDTGGLSAAFGSVPPPNGMTYFRAPAGRYSDGRLVIDFIAESFGLPHLSAYLDSMESNFSHGANFATAGSTIVTPNITGYSPVTLGVQLIEFLEFHERSRAIRSRDGIFKELLPRNNYFSRSLYTVDIGQNDLTAGLKQNWTIKQVEASFPQLITQFSEIIKNAYSKGGRSFWVHSTGPIGCLIYMLDRYDDKFGFDEHGCSIGINELSRNYNRALREAVEVLRKDLPESSIIYVDVYLVKYTLITEAQKHGFKQPFLACCGHGGKYNYDNSRRCGTKITNEGKEVLYAKACRDPSVRISWDGIHYTEAANKWIFNKIVTGAFSDPPIPLEMACRKMAR
ncbi:hypothetical protein MLD38_017028 [Melastoma candidum]|uniref:Uncharacterized protein n=1 Tax=Melastoma candidum TaxID=119954 RepID=A0ACB9QP82_9MYRT|nr:hypothetical protein MLD38_017028 [Melastoma candidum]